MVKQSEQTMPAHEGGLSSFPLKLVAVVAMTCNHAGYIFYAHLPLAARCALVGVGGLTFPIMAFLLVEGYAHTSNLKHYAARLAIFAAIAQVPFWLFLGHEGNVLVTLLASLWLLWALDNIDSWPARLAAALAVILGSALCDWGAVGPVLVLMFHQLRSKPWGIAASVLLPVAMGATSVLPAVVEGTAAGSWANLPFLLYYLCGNTAAIPLLYAYNGTRGTHPMKWLFYVYYPAHIAVLGIVYLIAFGAFPALLVGLG